MRRVFIGPARYWLLWLGILAALYAMGVLRLHVHEFNLFAVVLLGVVVAGYLLILGTYREGMQITRIPLDDEQADLDESASADAAKPNTSRASP